MNRCLSVAILLGFVLILASAQGGTFHCPVRAILFQFHLFLPRPAGGRSSRLVSSSEVFPRFSRQTRVSKTWSQAASFGSYTLRPTARPAAFLPWVVGLTQSTVPTVLAGGTEEEERAFLALQRPEIFDIGQEFVRPSRRFLMKSRSLPRLLAHSQRNPDARRDRWRSSSSVAPIWSRTSTRWPATWRRTPSPVLTLSGATPRPLTPRPARSLAATPACWRT
jgi:hypothetical protein